MTPALGGENWVGELEGSLETKVSRVRRVKLRGTEQGTSREACPSYADPSKEGVGKTPGTE